MGLLTLLTDLGYRDHYAAALRARLLRLAPALPVLELSHGVEPYNIAHAVHVLRAVFRDFPAGTVHLVAVSDLGAAAAGAVAAPAWHAARFEGHYFVTADNGLLALLCDGRPDELVRLRPADFAAPPPGSRPNGRATRHASPAAPAAQVAPPPASPLPLTLNPTHEVLAPAAVRLAQGETLARLGEPTQEFFQLTNRQLRLQDSRITGHVVHVDHYGNLVTNISRAAVEVVGRGRPAAVQFGRETVRELRAHFAAAPPGEIVCTFNPQGCLCIAINQGNASELLGLYFDSQVDVRFE